MASDRATEDRWVADGTATDADATGGSDRLSDDWGVVERARDRVESLATDGGAFVVACKDTGVRPTPVSTVTFDSYEDAHRARAAARRYRTAVRALDPALPEYDLVVGAADDSTLDLASVRESTGHRRENGVPQSRQTVTLTGDRLDEWLRVDNAAVVHLAGPESLLDDELVTRQLDAKL